MRIYLRFLQVDEPKLWQLGHGMQRGQEQHGKQRQRVQHGRQQRQERLRLTWQQVQQVWHPRHGGRCFGKKLLRRGSSGLVRPEDRLGLLPQKRRELQPKNINNLFLVLHSIKSLFAFFIGRQRFFWSCARKLSFKPFFMICLPGIGPIVLRCVFFMVNA